PDAPRGPARRLERHRGPPGAGDPHGHAHGGLDERRRRAAGAGRGECVAGAVAAALTGVIMTEAEWLAGNDPFLLPDHLIGRASPLEVCERFVDGFATREAVEESSSGSYA